MSRHLWISSQLGFGGGQLATKPTCCADVPYFFPTSIMMLIITPIVVKMHLQVKGNSPQWPLVSLQVKPVTPRFPCVCLLLSLPLPGPFSDFLTYPMFYLRVTHVIKSDFSSFLVAAQSFLQLCRHRHVGSVVATMASSIVHFVLAPVFSLGLILV